MIHHTHHILTWVFSCLPWGVMVGINPWILQPEANINISASQNNLDSGIWFDTIIIWRHPYGIIMQADNWKITPPTIFSHHTIWNTPRTWNVHWPLKLEESQSSHLTTLIGWEIAKETKVDLDDVQEVLLPFYTGVNPSLTSRSKNKTRCSALI